MTDITRDDLRKLARPYKYEKVTPEELDRLAIERAEELGYVLRTWELAEHMAKAWIEGEPAKALRALLTDQCKTCAGRGTVTDPRATEASWLEGTQEMLCPDCGGRGWLPKDGVYRIWWCNHCRMTEYKPSCSFGHTDGQWMLVHPADWLEAEE